MSFPHIAPPDAAQVRWLNQQLQDFERWPLERQRRQQAESLAELFVGAERHSPLWRERLQAAGHGAGQDPWQTLARLPPLTRIDLQERFDDLSCAAAWPEGECSTAQTTGSTGRPVTTLRHTESFRLRYMALSRRCSEWHALDTRRPLMRATMHAQADMLQPHWGVPEAWFGPTGPLVVTPSTQRDPSHMLALMRQHQAGYAVANASVLHALARHALAQAQAGEAPPQLHKMLSTGETVTPEVRAACRSAFGAEVVDRYSCEEIGWLALQCPQHEHLHVLSPNVVLEIVDDAGQPCAPGQPGRVLVTALHSHALPLIRYEIGDMAQWGPACDCGLAYPVIGRLWGRQREFITLPDGTSHYVMVIAHDFLEIAPIRDMRFRLYRDPLLRMEVQAALPLGEAQRGALVQQMRRMVGFDCPCEIVQLPAIAWGPTDKRLSFASVDALRGERQG